MKMAASEALAPRSWAPLLKAPSGKSSQPLLSPGSLSTLHVHPACDRAFLSQAQDPLSSLQTLQTPVMRSPGKEGSLTSSAVCWARVQRAVA